MSTKMSVTNIRALKALYKEQIDKECRIIDNKLSAEEGALERAIMAEFRKNIFVDADAECTEDGRGYVTIHTDGHVDIRQDYIFRKKIPFSTRGKALKDKKIAACHAKKQRLAELDEWEIAALKATTVEDVPEFNVTVIPSTFECA